MIEVRQRYNGQVIREFPVETLAGAKLRNLCLQEADLVGADLRGADLSNAYLGGAALAGAGLAGALLAGACLGGADLRGADLSGADIRFADLTGAVLTGADLTETRFDEDTRWPQGCVPPVPSAGPQERQAGSRAARPGVLGWLRRPA